MNRELIEYRAKLDSTRSKVRDYENQEVAEMAQYLLTVLDERDALAASLADTRAALAAHVERLNDKLGEIKDSLYAQNLHVAGWHLNGATEPMDTWFEDNDWEPEPVPLQQESLS